MLPNPEGKQDQPYWEFSLPEPGDATTNGLQQMTEAIEKGEASLLKNRWISGVTCLEAPSNHLAIQMQMALLGLDATVEISVNQVQRPDPRIPRASVEHLLWKYNGTRPYVAVPEPMPGVKEAVCQIATHPFQRKMWWELAEKVARDTRPSRFNDVLWVMVHPPKPPIPMRAWTWIWHVQVAAALVIAQLEKGWEGSFRRKALLSMFNGPMDWTVNAAIVALSLLSQDNPEVAKETLSLFRQRCKEIASETRTCYEEILIHSLLHFSEVGESERLELRRRLTQMEEALKEASRRLSQL